MKQLLDQWTELPNDDSLHTYYQLRRPRHSGCPGLHPTGAFNVCSSLTCEFSSTTHADHLLKHCWTSRVHADAGANSSDWWDVPSNRPRRTSPNREFCVFVRSHGRASGDSLCLNHPPHHPDLLEYRPLCWPKSRSPES
jgi:hypothetical protein